MYWRDTGQITELKEKLTHLISERAQLEQLWESRFTARAQISLPQKPSSGWKKKTKQNKKSATILVFLIPLKIHNPATKDLIQIACTP